MNNLRLALACSVAPISIFTNDMIAWRAAVIYENWPALTKQQAHHENRLVNQHNVQYTLPQIQNSPRGWRRTQ